MKLYGRTTVMEGVQSDPAVEWSSPASDDTGRLEEQFWQLGLGAGGEVYPERPDDPDCIYYLRTGFCGYGERCRFNHPPDRGLVMGAMRAAGGEGEYPERVGQPVCQYYMRTGMCKYGTSCKYHHPRQGGGTVGPVALNISGYPIRPGEKECSYYVKTGQCKFGVTCKFDHPQPSGIQLPQPQPAGPLPLQTQAIYSAMQPPPPPPHHPSSQPYGVVSGNWPVARPTMIPGSYIQGAYSPMIFPSGMVSFPSFSPYQAPVSPASASNQSSIRAPPLYGVTQLSHSAPAYTGTYLPLPFAAGPSSSSQKEQLYPERPGQSECQYYMKTGECKFGSTCRYHHPPEWSVTKINVVLSSMGLPLRPGAQLCNHYAQNGMCKFGQSCKFDHPIGTLSYNTSTSSLADMAVAPYPIGSSVGTLAASSSSSSELKAEIVSGSNEALSNQISSSKGNSSGSIFSQSGGSSALSSSSVPSTSSKTDEPIKSVA